MRESKKPKTESTKVLLIYDQVTEGQEMYLVDVTPRQLAVLQSIHQAYINSDNCTDAQQNALDSKILPAIIKDYPGENVKDTWRGIWQHGKLDMSKPQRLPACQVFLFGFLP